MSSPVAIGTVGPLPKSPGRIPEPFIKERLPLMELPRGKFRSMERNTSLISLLKQLHIQAFQGSCRINHDGTAILLVFDQGKIILAEYDKLAGDAALDIICTHRFARVDAIISDLDDAQIRLSLEFNPSWKVQGDREPPCILSPEIMSTPGSKPSLPEEPAPEPEPEKLPEAASGSEIRSIHSKSGSSEAPGKSPASHDLNPADSVHPGGEPFSRERVGLSISDGADPPDWRAALARPLTRDDAVPSIQPEMEIPQIPEAEVDWKATPPPPLASKRPGEVLLTRVLEAPADVEGWKKALNMPVAPVLSEQEPSPEKAVASSSRISAVVTDFEPLTADSGLFDEITPGTKMPRARAPEPAEQWRSMGTNRGENSSV
jgi:hypothetical protein